MEKNLKDWIYRNTLSKDVWSKFDDLHVTGSKNKWLEKGIENYRLVNNYLKVNALPFYAELCIRLEYSKIKTGVNFDSLEAIENQLSSTPPSIYLFPINYKNLKRNKKRSTILKKSLFDENNAFYSEKYDESEEEFYRAIFIVPL